MASGTSSNESGRWALSSDCGLESSLSVQPVTFSTEAAVLLSRAAEALHGMPAALPDLLVPLLVPSTGGSRSCFCLRPCLCPDGTAAAAGPGSGSGTLAAWGAGARLGVQALRWAVRGRERLPLEDAAPAGGAAGLGGWAVPRWVGLAAGVDPDVAPGGWPTATACASMTADGRGKDEACRHLVAQTNGRRFC